MPRFIKPWAVMALMFFFGSILLVIQTRQPPPPPAPPPSGHCDTTSNGGLADLYGRTVTLHGRFDVNGVFGPYMDCQREEVYLKPPGDPANYSWSAEYDQLAGKEVSITGHLLYQQAPAGSSDTDQSYFYFDKWRIKVDGEQPVDLSGP
jgi:hypothetical protein